MSACRALPRVGAPPGHRGGLTSLLLSLLLAFALFLLRAPGSRAYSCDDYPVDWTDSRGYSCEIYALTQACTSDGGYGAGWSSSDTFADYASDGYDASTACCDCGGGLWETTTTSTISSTSTSTSTTTVTISTTTTTSVTSTTSTGTSTTTSTSTATTTSTTLTSSTTSTSSSTTSSSTTSTTTATSTTTSSMTATTTTTSTSSATSTTTTSATMTSSTSTVTTLTSSTSTMTTITTTTSSLTSTSSTTSSQTSTSTTSSSTTFTTSTTSTTTSTSSTSTTVTTTSTTRTQTTSTLTTTTSSTSTSSITTSTTTTPELSEALHLVGLDDGATSCGLDGEYWMVGKPGGASGYYIGEAPLYMRKSSSESAGQGNPSFDRDGSDPTYYLFYGLDCWSLWDSDNFQPETETCAGDDLECHLSLACYARIRCEGVDLLASSWIVSVAPAASSTTSTPCRAFAIVGSDDPMTPPALADWEVKCPGMVPAVTDYMTRNATVGELITTTTTTTSVTTTSSTTTTTVPVEIAVSASPTIAQSCNRASFAAILTTGALAPVALEWTWGLTTPLAVKELLPTALEQGSMDSSSGSAELSFLLTNLSSLVALGSVVVEVELTATNREGTRSSASTQIQVQLLPAPPTVAASSVTVLRLEPSEVTALELSTGETSPSCEGARSVAVRWEYTNATLQRWRNLTKVPWLLDANTALFERQLHFPAFTFQANSQHMFRGFVTFVDETGSAVATSGTTPGAVVFRVIVGAQPAPTVTIQGPDLLSRKCDFELTTSMSATETASGTVQTTYAWSCSLLSPSGYPDACDSLSNFDAANQSQVDGNGAAGASFYAAGGSLMAGLYSFSVTATTTDEGTSVTKTSSASFSLQLLADPVTPVVPPIYLSNSWEDHGHVSTASEASPPMAFATVRASPSDSCTIPDDWDFRWILAHIPSSGTPLLVAGLAAADLVRSSTNGEETLQLSSEETRGDVMASGETYRYALVRTSSVIATSVLFKVLDSEPPEQVDSSLVLWDFWSSVMSALNATLQEDASVTSLQGLPLSSLEIINGTLVTWSDPFIADVAPVAGRVTVSPQHGGEALRTKFQIEASDWSDDGGSDLLEYSFYSVPSTVDCLAVDWNDASQTSYWSRLGVRLLRGWSSSTSLEGMLPAGEMSITVRARDTLGASTTLCASSNITVLGSEDGTTIEEVEELLSPARASQEVQDVLAALDTLSASISTSTSSSVLSTCLSEALDLLEELPAALDLTNTQLLESLGLVVAHLAALTKSLAATLDSSSSNTESSTAEASEGENEANDSDSDSNSTGTGTGTGRRLADDEDAEEIVVFDVADRLIAIATSVLTRYSNEETGALTLAPLWALMSGLLSVDLMLDSPAVTRAQEKQAEASSLALLAQLETLGQLALRGSSAGDSWEDLDAGPVSCSLYRIAITSATTTRVSLLGLKFTSRAVSDAIDEALRRRRLADDDETSSCDGSTFDVQAFLWTGRNPHRHVANSRSFNDAILANATVAVVHFYLCGELIELEFSEEDPLHVTSLSVQPAVGSLADNYTEVTKCLAFDYDSAQQIWLDGYSFSDPSFCEATIDSSSSTSDCSCSATRAGGSFALLNYYEPTSTGTSAPETTTTQPQVAVEEDDGGLPWMTILALLALGLCLGVGGGIYATMRFRRRKKLSRVAAYRPKESILQRPMRSKSTLLAQGPSEQWEEREDEEVKKTRTELEELEAQFEELRQAALGGDAQSRKELLLRAKGTVNPSPQLIMAVDELTKILKKERAEALEEAQRRRTERLRDSANARSRGPPARPAVPPPLPALPSRPPRRAAETNL